MVAAESLACGTPVVGFDSGAPKEVAPDGYGIFVPYGDLNALYDALKGVKDNSIELNSSLDCEDFAKNRYSVEDMSHQYEEIYKKLLEKYENK
jgi:glycosyltransferase involved in cell wall biosynthesis